MTNASTSPTSPASEPGPGPGASRGPVLAGAAIGLLLAAVVLLGGLSAGSGVEREGPPYAADPDAALRTALRRAERSERLVLVRFGADWCPTCRHLEDLLRSEPARGALRDHFETVVVDVGYGDGHRAFRERWDDPAAIGIPALVVLRPDGTEVLATRRGELAAAVPGLDGAGLARFLGAIAGRTPGPDTGPS